MDLLCFLKQTKIRSGANIHKGRPLFWGRGGLEIVEGKVRTEGVDDASKNVAVLYGCPVIYIDYCLVQLAPHHTASYIKKLY